MNFDTADLAVLEASLETELNPYAPILRELVEDIRKLREENRRLRRRLAADERWMATEAQ